MHPFIGCNLERHLQWVSGLTYVSYQGTLRPGIEYMSVSSVLGQETASNHQVLRVETDRVVEIETLTKTLESDIEYLLGPHEGNTRVTATLLARSDHPVFGLALPLVESLMEERLQADLSGLKLVAESAS
ncbi:MAG TPA: hypothetical protein VGH44_03625 [Candidatus Saccharimonadia bacterium]|jgi:hypothetical protein